MTRAASGRARTAVALYVALAVHALIALGLALAPPPQDSAGPGVGLNLDGMRLDEVDRRLATGPTVAHDTALEAAVNLGPRDAALDRARAAPDAGPARRESADAAEAGHAAPLGGGGRDRYFARLRAHLSRFRESLPAQWAGARAQVRVDLRADGTVTDLALEQGSGIADFDAAALDLVRRASPFPQPPGRRAMRLVIPVEIDRRAD